MVCNRLIYSQKPCTSVNKYLYNGKELQDDNLGGTKLDWYDYGMRYYDPALARFTTQDAFAEKYYDFSPYQYGANNPVLFVDVNGDSLWITHRTGFLGLGGKQTLLYENGNLYNRDGTTYTGKVSGYLEKAKGALNNINAVTSGQGLLIQLEGSDFNFTIQRGSNRFEPTSVALAGLARQAPGMAAMAGSGGTIFWKPGTTMSGPNQLGSTVRPSFIGLTHELGHASMAEQGMSDFSFFAPMHADPNLRRITNDEFNAVHIENQVRSEYGLPLREFYTKNATGAGFMRFLVPATSINAVTGYDYLLNNPVRIPYVGPNSGR
jgi:RHS repeat-associated protein